MENITGEKPVSSHAKSILLTVLRPLTRHHMASMLGKSTNYEVLRQGGLQFINNFTGGSSSAMQIGAVSQSEMPTVNEPQCWPCNDDAEDSLYALGRTCYTCGGIGHLSWECPSKGKTKGAMKGKGDGKGTGNNSFMKGSFAK